MEAARAAAGGLTSVSLVRDAYDRRAAEYIELFGLMSSADGRDLRVVSSWADGLSGPVVDAGCGPGQWTDFLRRRGLDVRGVDQVPSFVSFARATYLEVPFSLGSLEQLEDAPGSVGGVLAWYSLIHYAPDAVQRPLREFARVLRPGGGLLVGLFTWGEVGEFSHAVAPAWRWPLEAFGRELVSAGFSVVATASRGMLARGRWGWSWRSGSEGPVDSTGQPL
ncbi:class I SAM-dependent methyltransferase [Leifsonia xyli]|uniref:class I SAM-dependent methyltransferase n=1 Tax=Leifsonia xyli TaxID=1575 RepID=UPI003D67484D